MAQLQIKICCFYTFEMDNQVPWYRHQFTGVYRSNIKGLSINIVSSKMRTAVFPWRTPVLKIHQSREGSDAMLRNSYDVMCPFSLIFSWIIMSATMRSSRFSNCNFHKPWAHKGLNSDRLPKRLIAPCHSQLFRHGAMVVATNCLSIIESHLIKKLYQMRNFRITTYESHIKCKKLARNPPHSIRNNAFNSGCRYHISDEQFVGSSSGTRWIRPWSKACIIETNCSQR